MGRKGEAAWISQQCCKCSQRPNVHGAMACSSQRHSHHQGLQLVRQLRLGLRETKVGCHALFMPRQTSCPARIPSSPSPSA